MSIPFVDCQGLAGHWTLGTAQAGFELVHRTSLPGGFGDQVLDANRPKFGSYDWSQETGPMEEWTPQHGIPYVCGTPPCSGFSLLNCSKGSNARGPESSINACMRELVTYASKCTGSDGKLGPEVVSFESVQGAFTQGRVLMQALRDIIERNTGQSYTLTHVLMSGSSTGGAQMRHRYFFVVHRVPFGVDRPEPRQVVTYEEAIGDLVGLKQTWDDQPLRTDAVSEWASQLTREDGLVGAHISHTGTRLTAFFEDLHELGWQPGETVTEAFTRLNYHPEAMSKFRNPDDSYRGWNWPTRINPDRPGYVLTGGGCQGFIHWAEPRYITVREAARLMGLPDDYVLPTGSPNQASMWIGKCCPVSSGRWISSWVKRSLEGNPGTDVEEIGDREFYHNSTLDYKKWPGGNTTRRR